MKTKTKSFLLAASAIVVGLSTMGCGHDSDYHEPAPSIAQPTPPVGGGDVAPSGGKDDFTAFKSDVNCNLQFKGTLYTDKELSNEWNHVRVDVTVVLYKEGGFVLEVSQSTDHRSKFQLADYTSTHYIYDSGSINQEQGLMKLIQESVEVAAVYDASGNGSLTIVPLADNLKAAGFDQRVTLLPHYGACSR